MGANIDKEVIEKDGWRAVWASGEVYFEFYDEGEFVFRCNRSLRDHILEKSGMRLVIFDDSVSGLITDI